MLAALDIASVPEQRTGVGRYVEGILSGFRSLKAQEEIVLFLKKGDSGWPRDFRQVGYASSRRLLRILQEQVLLPWLLKREGAPLIHGVHYSIPFRFKGKKVVTVHDLTFLTRPDWHEPAKRIYFRAVIPRAIASADAIVCVSERTRSALLGMFAPSGLVAVIPHGVEPHFSPDEPNSGYDRQRLSAYGIDRPYFLFVGTKEPRKNLKRLLQAYSILKRRRDDAPALVLAGRRGWGTLPEKVGGVVDLGFVKDEDLPALYRKSVAVVYPSFEEGFGLPALEALACGALLVTSGDTTMADVARGVAELVDPYSASSICEAMVKVLELSESERKRRSSAGIGIAASYTWERSARLHLELYERVVAQ